jgi:ubiquitin C-terminal hydrolase
MSFEENEANIPAVGLINFSKIDQKIKYYRDKKSNLNNVCYINSTIQCLFRLDEFVKNILKYDGDSLTIATQNLIRKMKNYNNQKRNYCSVEEIKMAMGKKNKLYYGEEEGDANEFISNYLNYLIEETKDNGKIKWNCLPRDEQYFNKFKEKFIERKGNSFILDLFYGVLRKETYCKNCQFKAPLKFNSFNILELPIYEDKDIYNNSDENLELDDILNKFISEKKIENDYCPKCQGFLNTKTSINTLPKCLIIYFSRDYSDGKQNKMKNIPKKINLEKFYFDASLNNDKEYFYHLKGIIFYSYNKAGVSHYKAICKVNNQNWYYFNDNYCKKEKNLVYQYDNPIFLFYEK